MPKDASMLLYQSRKQFARRLGVTSKKVAADSSLFAASCFFSLVVFILTSIRAIAAGVTARGETLLDLIVRVRCDETPMRVTLLDDGTTFGIRGIGQLALEDRVGSEKFKKQVLQALAEAYID